MPATSTLTRQALAVNIQLTYSSRQEQEDAAAAAVAQARPGVVIGGGHNLPRRGGRAGGGGGMRHSASEGAMAQALQASMHSEAARTAAAAGPSSVTFSAEDFPSVSGQGGSGTAPLGTWLGASGGPGGERGSAWGLGLSATVLWGVRVACRLAVAHSSTLPFKQHHRRWAEPESGGVPFAAVALARPAAPRARAQRKLQPGFEAGSRQRTHPCGQ